MSNKTRNILIVAVLVLFSACKYGPWLKYYMPHGKGHYPHATKQDRLLGSINRWRACYDVRFYDINVKPDIHQKRLNGEVGIVFTALNDFDTLLLDLHPSFNIKSITCAGSSVRYKRKKEALFVIFNARQKQGSSNKIIISYEGTPVKLLSNEVVQWGKDKNGKPCVNTDCQGMGASKLWPCKDMLYDEADSMALTVTVPHGLIAISNGKLRKKTESENGDTFSWFTSYPINMYNMSFVVGDYASFTIPYNSLSGKRDLTAWVLSYNLEKAKEHFKQLTDEMEFFEKIYGEYPWKNDGYKIIETPGTFGMEHQTAIAYGNAFRNNDEGYDDLIVHESAHEWWGNSMTAKDWDDIWLHEGFATLSEYLYLEHKNGNKVYSDLMRVIMHHPKISKEIVKNEVPIIKPANSRYCVWVRDRDEDVYVKGCFMLHTLRYAIDNDSLFFVLLKSFYQKHQKSIITRKDFMDHVNTVTGKDYGWFFKQYLFNYKVPELHCYISGDKNNKGNKVFNYKWKNVEKDFVLPLSVVDGTDTLKIVPSLQPQQIKIKDAANFHVELWKAYFIVKREKDKT